MKTPSDASGNERTSIPTNNTITTSQHLTTSVNTLTQMNNNPKSNKIPAVQNYHHFLFYDFFLSIL